MDWRLLNCMLLRILGLCLVLSWGDRLLVYAWTLQSSPSPSVFVRKNMVRGRNRRAEIDDQEMITRMATVYYNGVSSAERTAEPGYDITVDVQNSLWGFCPTTVDTATDCGLAGSCVDSHSCSDGCFLTGSGLTTVTWYEHVTRLQRNTLLTISLQYRIRYRILRGCPPDAGQQPRAVHVSGMCRQCIYRQLFCSGNSQVDYHNVDIDNPHHFKYPDHSSCHINVAY